MLLLRVLIETYKSDKNKHDDIFNAFDVVERIDHCYVLMDAADKPNSNKNIVDARGTLNFIVQGFDDYKIVFSRKVKYLPDVKVWQVFLFKKLLVVTNIILWE